MDEEPFDVDVTDYDIDDGLWAVYALEVRFTGSETREEINSYINTAFGYPVAVRVREGSRELPMLRASDHGKFIDEYVVSGDE